MAKYVMGVLWVCYGYPMGGEGDLKDKTPKLDDADIDAEGTEFGGHAVGDGVVGDDAINLFGFGDVHETAFVEFRGVKDCDHFVRLLNHDLVEQGFLEARSGNAVLD